MLLAISGLSRSGTTLLMELLNTHASIKVLYEANLFERVPAPWPAYLESLSWKSQNLEDLARVVDQFKREDITFAALERAMRGAFNALIVGDKLSSYMHNLGKFHEAGMKQIFIYRDARDAVASYWECAQTVWRHLEWAQVKSVGAIAWKWVYSLQLSAQVPVYRVRYEDLVENPAKVLNGVASYLEINPAFELGSIVVKTSSVGSYRYRLTDAELAEVMAVAGPTMERLGYGS